MIGHLVSILSAYPNPPSVAHPIYIIPAHPLWPIFGVGIMYMESC